MIAKKQFGEDITFYCPGFADVCGSVSTNIITTPSVSSVSKPHSTSTAGTIIIEPQSHPQRTWGGTTSINPATVSSTASTVITESANPTLFVSGMIMLPIMIRKRST